MAENYKAPSASPQTLLTLQRPQQLYMIFASWKL